MLRNTIGAATTALLLLTAAAPARAAPVTIGSPLSANFTQTTSSGLATGANTVLPEPGARPLSPVAGAVRRWRVQGTGTFTLLVLHPAGGGAYAPTANSAPVSATGAGDHRRHDSAADRRRRPGRDRERRSERPDRARGRSRRVLRLLESGADDRGDTGAVEQPPRRTRLQRRRRARAGRERDHPGGRAGRGRHARRDRRQRPHRSDSGHVRRSAGSGVHRGLRLEHHRDRSARRGRRRRRRRDHPVGHERDGRRRPLRLPPIRTRRGAAGAAAPGRPRGARRRPDRHALGRPPERRLRRSRRRVLRAGDRARRAVASKRRARAASVDKAKKAKRAYLTVGARKAKIKAGAKWTATVSLDHTGRRLLRGSGT